MMRHILIILLTLSLGFVGNDVFSKGFSLDSDTIEYSNILYTVIDSQRLSENSNIYVWHLRYTDSPGRDYGDTVFIVDSGLDKVIYKSLASGDNATDDDGVLLVDLDADGMNDVVYKTYAVGEEGNYNALFVLSSYGGFWHQAIIRQADVLEIEDLDGDERIEVVHKYNKPYLDFITLSPVYKTDVYSLERGQLIKKDVRLYPNYYCSEIEKLETAQNKATQLKSMMTDGPYSIIEGKYIEKKFMNYYLNTVAKYISEISDGILSKDCEFTTNSN